VKLILKAIVLVSLFSTSAFAEESGIKVGVVHLMKVMAMAPQQEAVSKKLEGEFKERAEELRKLENEMKTLYQNTQRDQATMSREQITEVSRKLESMQTDMKLKDKAFQEDLKRRQMEERQKLSQLVKVAIDKVAKAGNYDLVLNTEAVAFISDRVDITDEVIKTLSAPSN